MKWFFVPQLPGQVETEVTQRDQFKNDEVDLSDTLVREAVQNSLDAAIEPAASVEVSFRWLNGESELSSSFLSSLFEGHLEHAAQTSLELDRVDFNCPSALVIEDFGTKGLTGSISKKDDDNFSDFWRRHGKSHKTGKSRGRWGLGKLVYSTASQLSAFFGATLRAGDIAPHIMGQTVLGLHHFDDKEYPPHAFFADVEGQDLLSQIQVPIRDSSLVNSFIENFSLRRAEGPGLSVIIPFPTSDLRMERMIGVAIVNYFYPLLTGQLILKFDDIEVNAENVRELAHIYAKDSFHDIDTLFDFITEVYKTEDSNLLIMKESWADDAILDESDFDENDVETIRRRFMQGELVGLKLPLEVVTKAGEKRSTSFSVFIQRPEELSRGVDLYVRGGLTLPQEAKFKGRKALGAMIAEDEVICSFLGDAENAAHTRWIANAEKLRTHYKNPQRTLKVIKNVVLNLYDMLADVAEEYDEQALRSFFWSEEPDKTKKPKSRRKSPITIPKPPAGRPKDFQISSSRDGFTVSTVGSVDPGRFPKSLKITAAYHVSAGNPFKKFSALDFSFKRKNQLTVALTKDAAKIISVEDNELELLVTSVPFKINVTGFDVNRDLKVKLTAEG